MRRFSIRRIAPTVARAMGVRPPRLCNVAAIPNIARRVDRCFIFAADAVPDGIIRRRPDLFRHTRRLLTGSVPATSVHPAVTPVCFASMFTGASPRRHGLRRHAKPVLRCETLFDVLIRARKRIAIVAVKGQSLDRILRGRRMDYFSEAYDPEVVVRSLRLLRAGWHDVIVAYNQAYDDAIHATHPVHPLALRALAQYDRSTRTLFEGMRSHWAPFDSLFLWVTDHGCHVGPSGHGAHGRRIAGDLNVRLFYRRVPSLR